MKNLVLLMAVLSSFQLFAVMSRADQPPANVCAIGLQDIMAYPNDPDIMCYPNDED